MNTPAFKWHSNSMRRALACASIVLIGACGAAGARSSGATITRLDDTTIDTSALTERIEALTRAANVQGLTVTIFNGAERVYTRAFGVSSLPGGKPLRTDTEIYGASLSKAVFSVLFMKLVEQGVLELDKPLQDYVGEPLWQNRGTAWHEDLSDLRSDPRYRRITARMSMSHTSAMGSVGPAANATWLGRIQGGPRRRLPALFHRVSDEEAGRAVDEQQRQCREHLRPPAHVDDRRHVYAAGVGELRAV